MLLLKLLLTPPTFTDEEKTHQAYLLLVILLTLIIIPIPYFLYVLIRIPEETRTRHGESLLVFVLGISLRFPLPIAPCGCAEERRFRRIRDRVV